MNQIQLPFPGIEMNINHNKNGQHLVEKQFPGCLGRMVNLFDVSTGVAGNRLLTDRPHQDGLDHVNFLIFSIFSLCTLMDRLFMWKSVLAGSSLSRSRSDIVRMQSPPLGDHREDKLVVNELRNSQNKKANGTPMKTLIAQEMSKEVEPTLNPPNLVAKLMGLETLPRQQPNSNTQRCHSRSSSRSSLKHPECWEQDYGCEEYWCEEQEEYKDVYEIWQKSRNTNYSRESSPHKARPHDNVNEKKMALIRQKFMEAKRLSTDQKLRDSKEFQDALEILSSNRELFLQFLQEPNSMFSQQLYDLHSVPPLPESKHITILRPSRVVEDEKFGVSGKRSNNQSKKPSLVSQSQTTGWNKHNNGYSPPFSKQNDYPSHPTRIVVLKPSPGRSNETKAQTHFYDEPEEPESREVAKKITRQMRENFLGQHQRDENETYVSSVYSNGYVGDDSSIFISENEYTVENLSDSEIMSPNIRQSWDFVNQLGSPYSCSSFSRASCSPESSVCKEAKKRLSERWAMMSSNGFQEQRHVRRSSSTLGEMLALSDVKKSVKAEEKCSIKEEQPRGSTSCLPSDINKEENIESPKNLLRSKSVPVSSTVNGVRLNVDVSNPEACKPHVPTLELTKAKNTKSTFRGKVSSLFFSKNKKSCNKKSETAHIKDGSECAHTQTPLTSADLPGEVVDQSSPLVTDETLEEHLSPELDGLSSKCPKDLSSQGERGGIVSWEAGLSVAKAITPGNVSENQDQPSPISVLEPPFEEDDSTISDSCSNHQGGISSLKSNLIDKSPPIESIARTLSWDDSRAATATTYPLKLSPATPPSEEEEQDWLPFIRTILSAAGFNGEIQPDTFARWHSLESPLDPSLRDKYANTNEKELVQEAKRRHRRSNKKLVFDCVNASLIESTRYGSTFCIESHLADHMWAEMKEWFGSEVRYGSGDDYGLVVDRVVRHEVAGNGWVESFGLELEKVRNEIEGKLVQELVEDLTAELWLS
ncbi:hypothetical protein ACFE04_031075 [Oxalis oulophora]